ncbi:hypothetical protein SPLC1_S501450 [Arthrospira platensis C1]|nr:hypothetical protein SPLC1_S501450 [Arthrospira platensis C1]
MNYQARNYVNFCNFCEKIGLFGGEGLPLAGVAAILLV